MLLRVLSFRLCSSWQQKEALNQERVNLDGSHTIQIDQPLMQAFDCRGSILSARC